MTPQELENIFPSIVRNESKLRIWLNNGTYYLYAWYNNKSLYLHPLAEAKVPPYDPFLWHSSKIYDLFEKIVRIENYDGDVLKPIYTKFDGVISKDEPLVKVGYKYYTEKYMLHILDNFAPIGMS